MQGPIIFPSFTAGFLLNLKFKCMIKDYNYNLYCEKETPRYAKSRNNHFLPFLRPLTNVSGLYSVVGLAVSVVHASIHPSILP